MLYVSGMTLVNFLLYDRHEYWTTHYAIHVTEYRTRSHNMSAHDSRHSWRLSPFHDDYGGSSTTLAASK